MDLVERMLIEKGISGDHIFIERFNMEPATTTDPEPAPGSPGPQTASITVILKGKAHSVPFRPGNTILETARRAGLSPPFSCQAGDCATCMAILREGNAVMKVNHALTPEELEEGWILTCQAVPSEAGMTVEYEAY